MRTFARALAALLVVVPVAATDRRLPSKGNTKGKGGDEQRPQGISIHGQQVYPQDHILAPGGYVTVVVTVKDGEGEALVRAAGDQAAEFHNSNFFAFNVKIEDADAVMTDLENDPHIKYVEFDKMQQVPPNEQGSGGRRLRRLAESVPWGITMVMQDDLHFKWADVGPPAGSVKVCVVDTGYGNGHEDLPVLDTNADGFIPDSYTGAWHVDGHGHGTHCAGTIGGIGGNDKGVVGVIPNDDFSFFIGKGLSDAGSGSGVGVMSAVQSCVDAGAKVISMSLGGGAFSSSDQEEYGRHYEEDDVLIIAAAGNSGNSVLSYPASYPSIMSVAAVDSSKNHASFSQFNTQVEIAAPGVGVESTITQPSFSYDSWSGTSMACPHVAGVAGLLRAYFPNCKAGQIRTAMIATAEDRGDPGCDVQYGYGIVGAQAAYQYLMDNECEDAPFTTPVGGCAQFSCTQNDQCDDGNDNTSDTCIAGQCHNGCLNAAGCATPSGNCLEATCTDGVCSASTLPGFSALNLELLTDTYGSETAWNFKNSATGEVLEEGSGLESNTLYSVETVCEELTEEMEVIFTITDSYGDGICCSYGSGYYKVMVNGEELASGGDFGEEATDTFVVPPNPAAPPTVPPLTPPTLPPLTPPTPPPPAPTPPAPTPPVGGDPGPADPNVINVDLDFTMRFTFTPQPGQVCVSDVGLPSGSSIQQCAQACASLATCAGFDALDDPSGACVLSMGGSSECDDDVTAATAVHYERTSGPDHD